jgi:mRNA degradation ribonuclease J1/J2
LFTGSCQGIAKLDILVGTHPHEDHSGGKWLPDPDRTQKLAAEIKDLADKLFE